MLRWLLPALLLLGACSRPTDDPVAVTPDQDRQLNAAAAMLDANSIDANTLDNESAP